MMAGGVGPGAAAQAVGHGTAKAAGAHADATETGDFAGLLGQAAPPADTTPATPQDPGTGTREDAPADPGGRESGTEAWPPMAAGAGATAPPSPVVAPDGHESLAGQMLALLGITLPGTAAEPAPALPHPGGTPGRAGDPLAGTPVLPGLAQPAGPAGMQAELATHAPGLQPQAPAGDSMPSTAQPFLALDTLDASALEAGRDTSINQAAAQPALQARPTAPALPAALAAPLSMPADPDGGFDDGLGARIGWMANQQLGRAEIRLNPEQLGVIDLRLELDGNRVSVELASASQDVRQALEASLARLREMLAQQGLDLARADVGSGQRDGDGGHASRAASLPDGVSGEPGDHGIDPGSMVTVRRQGLLDEYA